jgi:hypothetical protein
VNGIGRLGRHLGAIPTDVIPENRPNRNTI